MSKYNEYEKRGPSTRPSGSTQRSIQQSTHSITRAMASISINKKSGTHKSAAETKWDAIEKASPGLYDAMFKAAKVMRKLEAAGKIRQFRVRHPTIQLAPPRYMTSTTSKTRTTGYESQGIQLSMVRGGSSTCGLPTSSSTAASSTRRNEQSALGSNYSSSSSRSYACKYSGKTYDTRDKRGIHEGKHQR